MKQLAAILLVDDDTIDHHQWLGVDVERVQTLHKHHSAHTRGAIAADAVDVGTELVLNLVLDVDGIGVLEVGGLLVVAHIGLRAVLGVEGGGIEQHVLLLLVGNETDARGVVVGRAHYQCRCEQGHLDGELSIVLGEHTVAIHLGSAHHGTGHGLVGGGVDDAASDGARFVVPPLNDGFPHGSYFFFLLLFIVVLGMRCHGESQQQH